VEEDDGEEEEEEGCDDGVVGFGEATTISFSCPFPEKIMLLSIHLRPAA
jgi:hypothetical protein